MHIIKQMNILRSELRKNQYVDLKSLSKEDALLFLSLLETTHYLLSFVKKHYPKYLSESGNFVRKFQLLDDFKLY